MQKQLAQRIKKGTRIYIEGRLQTRSWDDKEGKKQYKTEVVADRVILIARFEGSNDSAGSVSKGQDVPEPAGGAEDSIDPSDLPF